jgi:hypothetical protein
MEDKLLKLEVIKPNSKTSITVDDKFYQLITNNYFAFCSTFEEEELLKCRDSIIKNDYNNLNEQELIKTRQLIMYVNLIQALEEGFKRDNKIEIKEIKSSDINPN